MTVQECHIGMVTMLPMMYDKLENKTRKPKMLKATCVWIHPKRIYATFQFECGIKETVYLDDETRLAKNTAIPPVVVPPELIGHRKEKQREYNLRIEAALDKAHVTRRAVSRKAGHSNQYLSSRLRDHEMDERETAYWLDMIRDVAAENAVPDPDDPHYVIRAALQETHLTMTEASRLLGFYDSWLSSQFYNGITDAKQIQIAAEIRKAASDRSESSQSDSAW